MRNNLSKIILSFFLLGVFFSPNVGQWVHLAEAHHAEATCSEGKVHLHAEEAHCELTATFTTPFTLKSVKALTFIEVNHLLLQPLAPKQAYAFQQIQLFYLRGPPQLLTFA